MKTTIFKIIYAIAVGVASLIAGGCDSSGIYSKVPPGYNLKQNQDKKILVWVEAPRSAVADVDASDKLTGAIRDQLITKAKIKPDNIFLVREPQSGQSNPQLTPEAAASGAGAGLSLFVRIEEYELLPMNIRNYYSGRMLTRAVLIDAQTGLTLWPSDAQGKEHDIVIELGQGERDAILSRMANDTAHCIVRNLYPIMKLDYKNSDERISLQEAFETETF